MPERLLFVEDEDKIKNALRNYFEKRTAYEIHTASDGEEAVALARQIPFDLIVADVVMPGGRDGIETIQEIRKFIPDIACIVITGFAEETTPIRALKVGVRDYIKKPFDPAELLNSVDNLLKLRRLEREAEQMRKSLQEFRTRLEDIFSMIRSTARLSSSAEPSVLFEAILRLGVDLTGAEAGAIFILDEGERDLHVLAGVGVAAGDESLPLGEGVAGKVASTGQPICGSGELGEQGASVEHGRRAVLAVPLEVAEKRLGVLEVFDKPGDGFAKRDIALLSSLARVAAMAISDNRSGVRVKDLLVAALRGAVGGDAASGTDGAERAIDSLQVAVEKVNLSAGQERAVRLAGLIAEIGQHGERELEYCEKTLTEFNTLLKDRRLDGVVKPIGPGEQK